LIKLWNGRGEVHLRAAISDAVRPGVLYSAKGNWLANSPSGRSVNALISADIRTDIEDGACYNETFVEAARL
jgi:anaerobic selenocysteine-containing dehydrogenase